MDKLASDTSRRRHRGGAVKLAILAATGGILIEGTEAIALAQTLPTDALPACTVTPATVAGWFKAGAIATNGVVNPADSVNFPNVPNCTFYQWSEQMFLWLNSPTPALYGGGGGRIFDSPAFYDVSPLDQNGHRTMTRHTVGKFKVFALRSAQVGPHGNPIVFDVSGKMFEIKRPKVAAARGERGRVLDKAGQMVEIARIKASVKGPPIFLDRAGKEIDVKLGPKGQPTVMNTARKSVPVARTLMGRNGFPILLDASNNVIDVGQGQAGGSEVLVAQSGSLVYYSTQVNDVYAYFATGQKNGGIAPAPTQFPTNAGELATISNFAQLHGTTFPDAEALAIEVKTSWVEMTGLDPKKYVTAKATIPTYDTSNPDLWVPNGSKTTTLALVGMHVVGSTKGHPEMIWATFEHFGNTPNGAYAYNSNSGPKTVAQTTAGTWLFSATNSSGPFNQQRAFSSPPNIAASDPATHIGPSDTLRVNPWGAPGTTSAGKNTEVIAINNSLLGIMNAQAAGDVRSNYLFTGATWTIGGAPPAGGNQVGTNQMSNSTLETYDQPSNCFDCHSGNMLSGISHIFGDIQPLFP